MMREIPYHRLWILPALLLAFLIQAACERSGPNSHPDSDTARVVADTARPEIPRPAPDATITDSLTHDFGGLWAADAAAETNASPAGEGIISFCRNGSVQYKVFRDGPTLQFDAKQVWIDRQHVHVDLFLTNIDRGSAAITDSVYPRMNKLFGTADLHSSSKMSVLWYARDFVSAVRALGNANRPEAFPAVFYYTKQPAACD